MRILRNDWYEGDGIRVRFMYLFNLIGIHLIHTRRDYRDGMEDDAQIDLAVKGYPILGFSDRHTYNRDGKMISYIVSITFGFPGIRKLLSFSVELSNAEEMAKVPD